jgi:serine/threonine-protein kinase
VTLRSAPSEVGSAANSYEILAKLAMGGMAEIFLAKGANNAGVERYVVLKRVLRHRADDAHFVRMFLDEARLASQLQHPNIAQVYDIGKLGDSYFFTMEYVHGETVRTLLQRTHGLRRQIPLSAVLAIIAGSAAGLHHAHERKGYDGKPLGIVHRDVSPSNLMVSYEGTVKVVDFGVAKAEHRSAETQAGTVKGKISYMSPEQCKGGDVDRRSDLFSLGILMWEMLTTERLFRRVSDFEAMQAIVSDQVQPPSTLRPDLPPEVDAIVMKLLAKAPADRYQTADELNEAVEAVAVRTGSAISAASLGRYMRELFGQRPEPWIELQSVDAHPEQFTVTSEPISSASELSVSPVSVLDLRLESVPDLAQLSSHNVQPVRVTADPELAPTMQMPPGSGNISMPPPMPVVRSHQPSSSQSNPQYPVLSSASHAAFVGRASAANIGVAPKRSKLPFIIMPALLLGVIIGVALALGSSGGKKAPTAHATQSPPPDKPVVMPATPPPTNVPVEPKQAAPVEEKPAAPVEQEPATAIDEKPHAEPKPDVAALYKEHQYADVVTACNASKTTLAANATTCTVAACKQREVSKARRWFGSVAAAKRANVQRECGTILPADKPAIADDECKRDPLACQH